MKNLLAGLLGSVIGAVMIVLLLNLTGPTYPAPYNAIWFIFEGSNALQRTIDGLLDISSTLQYFLTWILTGIIIIPFSKRGWNTLRSALWIGCFQAIFAIVATLLLNPSFWESPTRNLELVFSFSTALIVALLSLVSAIPLSIVLERVMRGKEPSIPERIESRCTCGAVFKSNPLICSECGKVLREPVH